MKITHLCYFLWPHVVFQHNSSKNSAIPFAWKDADQIKTLSLITCILSNFISELFFSSLYFKLKISFEYFRSYWILFKNWQLLINNLAMLELNQFHQSCCFFNRDLFICRLLQHGCWSKRVLLSFSLILSFCLSFS